MSTVTIPQFIVLLFILFLLFGDVHYYMDLLKDYIKKEYRKRRNKNKDHDQDDHDHHDHHDRRY